MAKTKVHVDQIDTTVTGHLAASAAVHGLPASVNVLGNRSAAGEFVQRGASTFTTGNTDTAIYVGAGAAITFAVAFSAAPKVVVGGTTSAIYCFNACRSITTTGFDFLGSTLAGNNESLANCGWIALGA